MGQQGDRDLLKARQVGWQFVDSAGFGPIWHLPLHPRQPERLAYGQRRATFAWRRSSLIGPVGCADVGARALLPPPRHGKDTAAAALSTPSRRPGSGVGPGAPARSAAQVPVSVAHLIS